ncbi:polysaccharide biosynthesis/export family protein [Prosthecodimorpha staleyi]|uniref:Polysaccharide export protein n=1 Tax=Prosthecodimorpha staleyi TaxID=2840188 RepID=A0A947D579_9HYPH|nr:polysaccharide biosynthesis/export family protein [Prosthecodimorpha staleyi]MBT9288367.1 polysaccharide export protein [Prosthecodimorpha staleyi]
MGWHRAIAVSLSLALAGCAGYVPPPPAFHAVLNEPYRFDSGDRLRITVFEQPSLTNSYVVDQAGYIAFPLVNLVPARGRTADQLAAELGLKLRNGFLRNPDVSVEVDQYRPFFVMGEVRNAGQYPYVPGMTAQNAIAIAGGFTARGNQSAVDITRQINGEVMTGRVPTSDPIRAGDTIYVRERLF